MKFLKWIVKALFAFIAFILLTVMVFMIIDSFGTNYLKIDKEDISKNSYLITNVHIIPMTQDTVLTNKVVYIEEGIIKQIGDEILQEDIPVFDAQGKYLMPGLIDMHVHVWDRYELGLYLSNGVTAVRNVWGMPMHLRMKEAVVEDNIYSPMFYTSGPKLTGQEFIGDDNLNLTSPADAKEKVISYKERGYDFIKTYYGLEKDLFDAIIAQAIISDIDIIAHPSQKVPFSYHTHPQIKSIEHVEEIVQQPLQFNMDSTQLKPIIDSLSGFQHTRYCPTLTVFHDIYQMMMDDAILDSEALKYMNPMIKKVDSQNQFDRWSQAKENDSGVVERIKNQHDFHVYIVSKLHEAGVPIICGTDAGIGVTVPGFSLHRELTFYREAGLTNFEVLQTATVNASKTHEMMNGMGTIEVGKLANLLLLDNNPLESLSAVETPSGLFIKGRFLDRKTLDGFKEKAKDRSNLVASFVRYIENYLIERF